MYHAGLLLAVSDLRTFTMSMTERLSCEYSWPLHHISALILLVALSSYVLTINSGYLSRLLILFGACSLIANFSC